MFKLSQVNMKKIFLQLNFLFTLITLTNCLKGEYISPEKIENVYLRSPFIAQIIIDGNSLKVTF